MSSLANEVLKEALLQLHQNAGLQKQTQNCPYIFKAPSQILRRRPRRPSRGQTARQLWTVLCPSLVSHCLARSSDPTTLAEVRPAHRVA